MSKTIDISVENNGTEVIIVSLERVGVEARVGNVERSITVDFGSLPQNIYWDEIQDKPVFHEVATSGDYNDLENLPDLKPVATSGNYNDLTNKPDLKPVATSGDYDDLSDKPQINGVTLQGNKTTANLGLATASQGALADTAYQKPQDGIPKSDLSSGVQASLNKADTALQEHQSLAGYATQSWVEDQGYLTQHQDISGKQDTLVSGENIKTINGESILGSGNIVIEGGGGTGDYEDLDNLPSINNVELIGNKTAAQLGLATAEQGNKADSAYQKPSNGIPASDLAEGVIPDVELLTPITYAALKSLRDGGNLTSGANYRITDYTCTTTQANTQSAGHVFDIIVTADSETELNENARAAHHIGDNYFANCKLESWKLKYSLDNDTNRFAWADDGMQLSLSFPLPLPGINTTAVLVTKGTRWKWKRADDNSFIYTEPNPTPESVIYASTTGTLMVFGTINSVDSLGKGVIYWMNDERNNECYYDFKNIMFIPHSGGSAYYYTFDAYTNSQHYDLSVSTSHKQWGCYNNHIGVYNEAAKYSLNGIIFKNTSLSSYCYSNFFEDSCYSMTFGDSCDNNKFGNDCRVNNVGDSFKNNVAISNFYRNTVGNNVLYNIFKQNCCYTNFGNAFQSNRLTNCSYSVFGNGIRFFENHGEIQWCDFTGSVKNIKVLGLLKGTGSQNKLVVTCEVDKNYVQFVALKNDPTGQLTPAQRLMIWNSEDNVYKDELYQTLGFPVFSILDAYLEGDVAVYDSTLYQFTEDHSGEWAGNDVIPIDLFTYLDETILGELDNISSAKADKVSNATSGNLAGLDGYGNLTDSGIAASDVATTSDVNGKLDAPSTAGTSGQVLTSDGQGGQSWQTPTSAVSDVTVGGTSVVTNGVAVVPAIPTVPTISTNVATDKADNTKTTGAKAVYDEVHPPLASTMPSGGFLPNIEYNLGTLNADTTFLMAAATDNTIGNIWYWVFETPSTTLNITFPSSIEWNGGNPPTIDPSKHYEITVKYNVGAFIVTDIPS